MSGNNKALTDAEKGKAALDSLRGTRDAILKPMALVQNLRAIGSETHAEKLEFHFRAALPLLYEAAQEVVAYLSYLELAGYNIEGTQGEAASAANEPVPPTEQGSKGKRR